MKKTLSVLLMVALMLTMAIPVMATPFPDVSAKHWAYDAVNVLYAAGIIEGYPDGLLRGESSTTRYEMIAMVARALQWLNTRIEEELKDSQDPAVLEKVVSETLEKRLGRYPKPDEVAQAIADISDIEDKFSKEIAELNKKVDELSKGASSEELAKIEAELGSSDVRLTALEKQLSMYTSELADMKAALQEALNRMDKIRVSGEAKVDLAVVDTEGPTDHFKDEKLIDKKLLPDAGDDRYSKFINTLNLKMVVTPDEKVTVVSDIVVKNHLGVPKYEEKKENDEAKPTFLLDSMRITVSDSDFVGTFGDLKNVTFTDLTLKDWEGEGALVGLTNPNLKGTAALFARDGENNWIRGLTTSVGLDKDFYLSGTYLKRSDDVDAIQSIGMKMAFLEGTVNLAGEYAKSGTGNENKAMKAVATGGYEKIDAELSYTKVGENYNDFGAKYMDDADIKEEDRLKGKAVLKGVVTMPLIEDKGVTLENVYKRTERLVEDTVETRNTTSVIYATKLAELNDSDLRVKFGITTDGWNLVSNNIALDGNWKLYDNLELLTGLNREKGSDVDKSQFRFDGAYNFKLISFNGKVKYSYNKYKDVAASKDWFDTIMGLSLSRAISASAKMELGYESISHTDENDSLLDASANVLKAGLAVNF